MYVVKNENPIKMYVVKNENSLPIFKEYFFFRIGFYISGICGSILIFDHAKCVISEF